MKKKIIISAVAKGCADLGCGTERNNDNYRCIDFGCGNNFLLPEG